MNQNGTLGELVTFENPDGFHLDGILYGKDAYRTTVVHVHGSLGNFYQNHFLRLMARTYNQIGINFLSFNLASHDGVGEGYFHEEDFEYVGGSVVKFDRCVKDIDGAVRFVLRFSDRVILQGHSLGCDRVLRYLLSTRNNCDFILLSPCDSYELQKRWIAPETVEHQIKRLKAAARRESLDWLPRREYGVKTSSETYSIPITRKAFLSIVEGPPFKLMRITSPSNFYLDCRSLVYIGGRDDLQTWPIDTMFGYLERRIAKVTRLFVPLGEHSLKNAENEVAVAAARWCKSLGAQP